jgi:hypothetical protein
LRSPLHLRLDGLHVGQDLFSDPAAEATAGLRVDHHILHELGVGAHVASETRPADIPAYDGWHAWRVQETGEPLNELRDLLAEKQGGSEDVVKANAGASG